MDGRAYRFVPVKEGSALLYGYVTGNFNDVPGTEIYYDNLRITPNKAAGKEKKAAAASVPEMLMIQPTAQGYVEEYRLVRRPLLSLLTRLRR